MTHRRTPFASDCLDDVQPLRGLQVGTGGFLTSPALHELSRFSFYLYPGCFSLDGLIS